MQPSRTVAAAVLALASLLAAPARGDVIDVCVSAATSGQTLERDGRLREARSQFLRCSNPECPPEVSAVCDRLLTEVESSQPTVVFDARDGHGGDLVAVRVRIDGTVLREALDGKAVAVDPGVHMLRFEHAGDVAVEQRVVVREAEKNRPLHVTFASTAASRSVPVGTWIFGGVGVASLGAFALLAGDGQHRYDACSPRACSASTVDSLSVERGLALGAAGVGVLSFAAAAWLFFVRPSATSTTASVVGIDVEAVPRGGVLRAGGAF